VRLEAAAPPAVLAAVRAPFEALAAEPLNTPITLPLSLFLDIAGEALRDRLFIVQEAGGEEACLRPDFTLGAMQAHLASGAASGRYRYEGLAFRLAPGGSTRAEQFLQIGLEAYETAEPAAADAAMAALAWGSSLAGGRQDLTLHLGDISLFGAFLGALDVPDPVAVRIKRAVSNPWRLRRELADATEGPTEEPDRRRRLTDLLAGLSEPDAVSILEDIWALAGVESVGGRSAGQIVHRLLVRAELEAAPRLTPDQSGMIARFLAIDDAPAAALEAVTRLAGARGSALATALKAWDLRLTALADHGVPPDRLRLSTAFGRSFAYYDGMVFEVRSAALGDDQPVAAGGRYDGLASRLGQPLATGAVGCMVRPGRAWREAAP